MKIVVDSNILISSFMFGGNPERLFNLCSLGIIEGFLSDETMREVKEKLCSPRGEFAISPEQWSTVNTAIQDNFKVTAVTQLPKVPALRDQEDLHILAAADICHAAVIVSGDKDLLSLKYYKKIPVVTVSDFMKKTG
jgi:putative PIN family toxin of toxin-antitoxin system